MPFVRGGGIVCTQATETLEFCTWNINSITANDFLRASLMEAYNSVYNYDLIGIVETHLDSTVDKDRLDLNGYTFIKDNHPQMIQKFEKGWCWAIHQRFPSFKKSS